MTVLDRTAYPRSDNVLSAQELATPYHFTEAGLFFIRDELPNETGRLTLAVLLSGGKDLGFYHSLANVCEPARKIEPFNDFPDRITVGRPVIKSGDPVEQEKQLKYASLVANAIMLSNVADLSDVLTSMTAGGQPVTLELVSSLSPYVRINIRRFANTSSTGASCQNRSAPNRCPSI